MEAVPRTPRLAGEEYERTAWCHAPRVACRSMISKKLSSIYLTFATQFFYLESAREQLKKTLSLLQMERQADLDQYRQKVLMRPLHARVKEGMTWYPVRLAKDYIGTGERIIIEVERTNQKDQPHAFQEWQVGKCVF